MMGSLCVRLSCWSDGGDGAGDEGGVLGLALDDDAERDDGIDIAAGDFLDEKGDLEGAGHFVVQDAEIGRNGLEFAPRMIDEPADVFAIVLAGDNGKGTPLADLAGAGWKGGGHEGRRR